MRAIGYCRVSTDKQSISMKDQEEKIRAMAVIKEVTLSEVITDEDESAKSLNRPGMARLLRMVDAGEVDIVIIAKLDRITRSVADLAELLKRFKRRGVAFVSVSDSLDTETPSGRLVMNIMVSVSQWEREAIGERTVAALQHLKKNGFPTGSKEPFGWKSAGRTSPTTGRPKGEPLPMIPVPEEQAALARILELDNEGKGQVAIASIMNSEGFQTRSGTPWVQQYVFRILKAERRKAAAA